MNEDLFPSHEAAVIANQRRLIAKFKKYDEQRTAEFHRLQKENDWYKEENKLLQDKIKEYERRENHREGA